MSQTYLLHGGCFYCFKEGNYLHIPQLQSCRSVVFLMKFEKFRFRLQTGNKTFVRLTLDHG